MKCPICGSETSELITDRCPACHRIARFNNTHTPLNVGWLCTRCHKINAPFVLQCDCLPHIVSIANVNTIPVPNQLDIPFDDNSR